MTDLDLPALPDDIQHLLAQARPYAPPVPPGAEAAVLAHVTATTSTTAATSATAAKLTAGIAKLGAAKIVGGLVVAAVVTTGVVIAAMPARTPPKSSYVSPVGLGVPSAAARSLAFVRANPALAGRGLALRGVPRGSPPAQVVEDGGAREDPPMQAPAASGTRVDPPAKAAAAGEAHAEPTADAPPEEQLLGDARDALARGDGDVALKKLQQDASAYPRGRLVEERRALTVVAFAQKGDKARATSAARAFEREYPQSLFLETVRSAVGP